MATLIAYQDGNWTGATTWKAVATGTNAAMTTTSASTNTTTSYVDSSAFTVTNTEVLEGLLLYCVRVNTTGTVSVALSDDNGTTATREVTVNASDLPASASWVFFKFGSTLTADGGSDYKVKVKGSSAGNATFFRDATAGNWARIIRKSDTASIATTDVVYICDELTGAGTKNDITVTMDSTATTAYGDVNIGQGGVLSYGTSASTNYYLKLTGNLNVWGGGTLNIGTSGTRIPSTSTAVLEFNCGSNVQYGLEVRDGGTCNIYGATKSNTKVLLTADANSGQKVVTVQDTTGWAANDEIAIASTTRTASQSEKRTISTVDSGTQVTVDTNLSATHQGTAPYQGEVINLTRNVKIRGMSASLQSYVNCAATSSFTADNAEFYWLGANINGKYGVQAATTSAGIFSVTGCSFHDLIVGGSTGVFLSGNSHSATVNSCVFFGAASNSLNINAATSGVPVITDNWALHTATNIVNFNFADVGGTITGNRAVGGSNGFSLAENGVLGTFANNIAHSSGTAGFAVTGSSRNIIGTVSNCSAWRNADVGSYWYAQNTIFDGCSFYHNANQSVNSSVGLNLTFRNCTFNGGTGQSLGVTTMHLAPNAGSLRFENCNFGQTNQATNLISLATQVGGYDVTFVNCNIAESPVPLSQSNLLSTTAIGTSAIKYDKFNQTSGSHRAYKAYGYTASDQGTFRTAAPSEALIPNNASNKLPSGSKKFAVANGGARTVTVYVNKSATYNGNQPRLIVKRNIVGGITTDTVLATASGGTGSWLTLTGTTATVIDDCVLEVYVDCDGTAGTVYVDDWSVS